MITALLIYPHQLFENHPLVSKSKKIFLIEEPLMFTQYKFHKQKLILHRASMQAYKEMLIKNRYQVEYIEIGQISKTEDIADILVSFDVSRVELCDPVDDWIMKKLSRGLKSKEIDFEVFDTPMFLCNKVELDSFFGPILASGKKFLMSSFYIWQRKRLDILVENNKPTGGKWSYDKDNQLKIPKGLELPNDPVASSNPFIVEAKSYIQAHFSENYGEVHAFFYPVTHNEARIWLKKFLEVKFTQFGPYEDAMTSQSNFLFHSILSPLLNNGLLIPKYVIDQTLEFASINNTPMASLEGFIRQIVGWREYIRAVYIYYGVKERTTNYFGANRNIPQSFWTAKTGILPVDEAIKGALKYAYSHHIPRLMVMGNFMNLCGFEPDKVYRWFMEMYIDSYDWVMVPNVYSMALYADGGLITTKPYISGSSYILKMSDYKKGDWSEIWDALFWNFVDQHFRLLSKEGRLGFIGVTYTKMPTEKKILYRQKAQKYLMTKYGKSTV